MLFEFSTKPDRNGNRYYLGIDTDKKTYSRQRSHWYTMGEVIPITRKARGDLIAQIKKEGYDEIDSI